MALDKQRILNELGSVVNQLQSADCGCMGKLFSIPGQPADQNKNRLPTCGGYRHGCCHGHGYMQPHNTPCGTPCAGEPYPLINANMNGHFATYCNPPKLYADTYNYLNQNLMQPVVKEVYDDLKSITPANTVMNNSIGNAMALSSQRNEMKPNDTENYMELNETTPHGIKPAVTMQTHNKPGMNMLNTNGVNSNQPGMGQMSGMGPNIVSMIMGSTGNTDHKANMIEQQLAATPSIPGQMQNNERIMQPNNGLQIQNPPTKYMSQQQMAPQSHLMSLNSLNQSNSNANPYEQMSRMNPAQITARSDQARYGAHSQGVKKFNEMFPGVTQGFSGGLDFDPMAIAIQMNPANQRKAAMDNMHKLMGGTGSLIKPTSTGANAAAVTLGQNVQPINNQTQRQLTPADNQFQLDQQQIVTTPGQQRVSESFPSQQQQIYTASTINQPQMQNHLMYNPNAVASNMEQNNNAQLGDQTLSRQQIIKEPIFPTDTSKIVPLKCSALHNNQRPYEYNTLGEPIDMLSPKLLHNVVPNSSKALTPHSAPARLKMGQIAYSNVKPTISKTSIAGNKPVGKTPSRNQLQQIYNQYKGSHSYTRQNITQPAQSATHSDGKLNVTQKSYNHGHKPVEQVGGDSAVNNEIIITNQTMNKVEGIMGQVGDAPLTKSDGDDGVHEQIHKSNNSKCRNGLQDMVFTAYTGSVAWSFHGNR
ncbi:hypothetical protein K1T71_009561 [Dendrolimus kikuchii]|uniref:Uncharacterized protein n=1 Tax=Dendrolimus kikuchii TaxID=765133 RepID=A0ACC1CRZ4_9NEOP|nr:hypothetical protein K1T71_009561 [Dendrolimus kikuchii]